MNIELANNEVKLANNEVTEIDCADLDQVCGGIGNVTIADPKP